VSASSNPFGGATQRTKTGAQTLPVAAILPTTIAVAETA